MNALCGELVIQAMHHWQQFRGGFGYIRKSAIERTVRNAHISAIGGGAATIILTADDNVGVFNKSVRFRAAEHVNDFLPMPRHDILKIEEPRLAISQTLSSANVAINDINLA